MWRKEREKKKKKKKKKRKKSGQEKERKVKRRRNLLGGAKFRGKQKEELSGCVCTNNVHIHDVQVKRSNASIVLTSTAEGNAMAGSGMVSAVQS